MIHILVVEDDEKLRNTIQDYLTQSGFDVLVACDGVDALEVFEANKSNLDIILLDVMLPRLDGLEVLKEIRRVSDVPIIIISARETESDQLQGFYMGADTYITKPFMLSVLREQIVAIINRTSKRSGKLLTKGALQIDTQLHRVYVDGQEITTTPKEYDLLMYFITNEKIVLDRNTILDRVWGFDYFGDFRTVDTIIKQLRKKLTDKHKYIKSVYGVGYYFEVDDAKKNLG